MDSSKTIPFTPLGKTNETREALHLAYEALKDRGFEPERQIIGYIMSGDPTYITSHMNARACIQKIDEYDLLREVVHEYFSK